MGPYGRRRSIIAVSILGSCLLAVAVGLQIGWIVINWRATLMLVLGVLFFLMLIAGVALNMVFLIREIKKNEQHDSFINAVTHELKTPVASIRLYLETLKTRELDPQKRLEFYDTMLSDSDRLLSTIEQVLQAGRTGSARKPSMTMRVEMGELVQECISIARLRHRLPADAIAFETTPNAWVQGDPDELRAAVTNLLDNAVKYSVDRVNIRAVVERAVDKVAVSVQDAGVGIPPQELKNVFKRFYRIPGAITQRVKGTGLGLFIVNSIARRHRGKVLAASGGAGQGSTFTLVLPAV